MENLVTLIWWRFLWRNNDVVTIYFLKLDFVIISFKNHNLAKSRNFKSPKSKIMKIC